MPKRIYYTLARRVDGTWCAEFGDYDRATVEAELQDHRDHDVKRSDLRIIKSAPTGIAVDDAMHALNQGLTANT